MSAPEQYRAPRDASEPIPAPPLDRLGLLGQFATELARSLQTTSEFALATALGALAVPCGIGLTVEIRSDWHEPALLQMLVAAAPGERKTPALAATVHGLRHAERELSVRRDQERREAEAEAEVLKERVARARKSKDEEALREAVAAQQAHHVPPRLRIITRSGTGEALERLAGEQGGRLAIITDEGGALFGDLARYGTTPNYELLLAGHDATLYSSERITREPVVLDEVRVPVLAMAQPAVLAGLLEDAAAVGRGVVQRLAIVSPGSLVGMREGFAAPVDPTVAERWHALLRGLMLDAYVGEPALAVLSAKARDRLEQYHDDLEPRLVDDLDAPLLREWCAKHVGRVARLAAILTAARTGRLGGEVTEDAVDVAAELGDWLLAHAVRVLWSAGPVAPKSRTQEMADALVEAVDAAGGRLLRDNAAAILAAAGFGEVPDRTIQRAIRRSGLRVKRSGFQGSCDLVMPADCESGRAGSGDNGDIGEFGLTCRNAEPAVEGGGDIGEYGPTCHNANGQPERHDAGERVRPGHAKLAIPAKPANGVGSDRPGRAKLAKLAILATDPTPGDAEWDDPTPHDPYVEPDDEAPPPTDADDPGEPDEEVPDLPEDDERLGYKPEPTPTYALDADRDLADDQERPTLFDVPSAGRCGRWRSDDPARYLDF